MNLRYHPYTLELSRTFTIATVSRTTTPAVIVAFEHDGITGYGEASLPPYLNETQGSVGEFLSKVNLSRYNDFLSIDTILQDIDSIASGNYAAKASVDIALHDWAGKKVDRSWHEIWKLDAGAIAPTSFTIGIDTIEELRKVAIRASRFKVLKVKLGRENDKDIISAIRDVTDTPIRVDVNQGWTDKSGALRMIEWLATKGVELVEQPLPKEHIDDMAWLYERSPLPLVADESVQRLRDVDAVHGIFNGINIKLMKCGGMLEAYRMVERARKLGLKVMIGCMTETSCAISAAAQLAPLADWVDLDGALLIDNDIFDGVTEYDGLLQLPHRPGIGVVPKPHVML